MKLINITDFSQSTLASIFAAIVIFFLGYFLRWAISAYRFRDRNQIWKPFLSYSMPIPTFIVDKPGSVGSLGKVSLTDVEAFSDLRSEVERVGGQLRLERASLAQAGRHDGGPIICLGGPLTNSLTALYLDRFDESIPVQFSPGEKGFYFEDVLYSTEINPDTKGISKDYALTIYVRELSPQDNETGCGLVIFGLRGVGTNAAVTHFIKGKQVYRQILQNPKQSYWALIEVNLTNGQVSKKSTVAQGVF